ncbi:MAG: hypothetical protein KDD64_01665 [Bdellovibrionales bacterium]|nr:hypothetical protein [Bdellovibrionales bacterium]
MCTSRQMVKCIAVVCIALGTVTGPSSAFAIAGPFPVFTGGGKEIGPLCEPVEACRESCISEWADDMSDLQEALAACCNAAGGEYEFNVYQELGNCSGPYANSSAFDACVSNLGGGPGNISSLVTLFSVRLGRCLGRCLSCGLR